MAKKEKLIIAGVTINLKGVDTDKVKNLEDVKKLDVFSHLEGKEKTDAEKELAMKLDIKLKGEPNTPTQQ